MKLNKPLKTTNQIANLCILYLNYRLHEKAKPYKISYYNKKKTGKILKYEDFTLFIYYPTRRVEIMHNGTSVQIEFRLKSQREDFLLRSFILSKIDIFLSEIDDLPF